MTYATEWSVSHRAELTPKALKRKKKQPISANLAKNQLGAWLNEAMTYATEWSVSHGAELTPKALKRKKRSNLFQQN